MLYNMATVKFLIQSKSSTAPIYLRLSLGRGNSPKRKTGSVCDSKDWSTATGFPKDRSASNKELKSNLMKLESFIIDQFNNDNSKGIVIDGNWLEKSIDKFHGREEPNKLEYLIEYGEHFIKRLPFRVTKSGKRGVNKDTITKYTTIVKKLRGFQEHKKKRYFVRNVDLNFRSEFLEYLTQVDKINDNTAGRYISFVKTIVLDARKNGILVSSQINDFTGFTVEPPIVAFSFDEIEIIKGIDYNKEEYNIARDWFVLGCYVGQRASDLFRMNTEMIESIEGHKFIVLTQVKTKELVQIPVHDEVQNILDKWNGNFPPKFSKSIDSCTTMFNRYIKEVFRIAEIDGLVKGNLNNPETNRYETGEYPKWKLVSSHSCRRSFATNFYAQREYPTPLLMSVTGHKTETMFLHYIGKKPIDYALQLAQIWARKTKKEGIQNGSLKLTTVKTASSN